MIIELLIYRLILYHKLAVFQGLVVINKSMLIMLAIFDYT